MTSAVVVTEADPRAPEARALIDALTAELAPHYTPEETFGYPVEKLVTEGVFFVVARRDGEAVACGGLQEYPGYGELKRFYVSPDARGTGAAGAVMHAIEAEARRRGLIVLRLETGKFLVAAIRFYGRHGFVPCPRFGDYPVNESSVYLEKRIG